MPIYEQTNGVLTQVGKIIETANGVHYEINKGYETANGVTYEVYSGETQIYPGYPVYNYTPNSGLYGSFYSNVNWGASNNSTVVYIEFDATGYNTLRVSYITSLQYYVSGLFRGLWLIYPSNRPDLQAYPYYYVTGENYSNLRHLFQTNGTVDLNIAPFAGTMRLCLGIYQNSNTSDTCHITSAILT